MNILKELRFGSGRVTAEEDVDIASIFGAAALFKGFVGPAEELEKDTFLYIVHFIDARGE